MATSITQFDKIQIGKETVKGTLVAATRELVGNGTFVEEQDFYRSAYPRGIRGMVGGAGVITRKGMSVDIETDLTAEEVLWPLSLGIRGGVSPSATGNDQTWVFTPQLSGEPTLDSATVELMRSDGTTNHYYGEFGYAICESFSMDWALNQTAKLNYRLFGRARKTGTATAALNPYTSRQELVTPLLKVYADTSWAGLGGSQLTALVRSANLSVTTGNMPNYTMDGRADLDMVNHKFGALTATLSMTLEFDTNGLAQSFTKYRANNITYIRLKQEGTAFDTLPRTVQVDGAYRFTAAPSISADGDQNLVSVELEAVYDETGTKMLEFTVINGLAAL